MEENGGPRRFTRAASRTLAKDDVGDRTSPFGRINAERVPAAAETTAGMASGCSARGTPNIVVGRSDAIAVSAVIGSILTPMGSGAIQLASVRGSINDTTDHTRTAPISTVPTFLGRASHVSTLEG